ncbi:hypothetical protein Tco_0061159, partial [Tanacetum coccineum]
TKDEENREWRHVAANKDITVVDQEEKKQDMPISNPRPVGCYELRSGLR